MNVLDAALLYAAAGWPVFPCHPENKRPLVEGGFHSATTSEQQIRAWWQRFPKAMIGVPMGPRSGVFAIDLDLGDPPLITGDDYLERFRAHVGGIPPTPMSRTGSGGVHVFLKWDAARPVDNSGKRLVPALSIAQPDGARAIGGGKPKGAGIDGRGDGGYVVVPPSVRADGSVYEWIIAPELQAFAEPTDALWRVALKDEPGYRPQSISDRAIGQREGAPAPAGQVADLVKRRYCQRALESEKQAAGNAAPGQRNNALNIAALKLGELVQPGGLSEREVWAALEDAAEASGLAQDDGWTSVKNTIRSGLRKGMSQPRDLGELRDGSRESTARRGAARLLDASVAGGDDRPPDPDPPGPPAAAGADVYNFPTSRTGATAPGDAVAVRKARRADGGDVNLRLAFLPHTDLGNSERFLARYSGEFLWSSAMGWLYWDGRRYCREGAFGKLKDAAKECVRLIQDEANALAAASDQDVVVRVVNAEKKNEQVVRASNQLAAWGRASESSGRINAIIDLVQSDLEIAPDRLDADPYAINVLNGTLFVDRAVDGYFVFKAHDRANLITKLAPVTYDPAAACPQFLAFLELVQPKEDNRLFLQQWGGYSMTADISEQVLTFNYGKGKNGKSTLFNAWANVLGDYGKTIPIETFINDGRSRSGGQATPDLAMLKGVRLLLTSEPERGAKLAEALIKLATGGDPMMVRHLNKEYFELLPQFKLTMGGNYRPKIIGTDEGIWRRVRLIPWLVTIPAENRDKHFGRKLAAEASGILNWMLDGLRDWLDRGLIDSSDIAEATNEYRESSDPMGRFLSTCVVVAPDHREQSSVMHQVFVAWCRANGEAEWTNKGMSLALEDRGYVSKKSDVKWWLGVRLIKKVSDFVDGEGRPLRMSDDDEPIGNVHSGKKRENGDDVEIDF